MDYVWHYNSLISRARNRILEGYTENHHIVPRCLGGTDDNENVVMLTAREHFLAHLLLVKIYPLERKLLFAARMMAGNPTGKRNTNKTYGWVKERISSLGHSRETKEKMSKAHSGKNNHFYGRKHTQETKEYLSEVMKGRMIGDKNPFYGKRHPKEVQDKIAAKNTGRKNSIDTIERMKGKVLVVDQTGSRYYISKDDYYSQIGPKEQWCWVFHRSDIAKKRFSGKY